MLQNVLPNFEMFFDSAIKLNKFYAAVEKHLRKNFPFKKNSLYKFPFLKPVPVLVINRYQFTDSLDGSTVGMQP